MPAITEEDKAYEEMEKADDEVCRLHREGDAMMMKEPDRMVAERRFLEEFAPRIDEARRKSAEAQKKWLALIANAISSMHN